MTTLPPTTANTNAPVLAGGAAQLIPLCDLKQQYLGLKDQIDAAMASVAATGHYVLGPQVKAFQQEIAEFCGAEYAYGVGNGTDALHLALRALGVGPGDEVITTPFTFVATSEAIGLVGATPVFVDIDPISFNLDANLLQAAITPRTKAIMPVHLYGQPCDMQAVMGIANANGLAVVEDCAQALGAQCQGNLHQGKLEQRQRVGTLGHIGCYSFFPSKNLGCFGDGGLVVTNDPELAERLEMLRRHGGKVKYHHCQLGLNSRLDELQAAILRIKLPHLNNWSERRREIAARYSLELADLPGVTVADESRVGEGATCVYHQYTLRVPARDEFRAALAEQGVQSFPYYPVPLHRQEVHEKLGYAAGSLPHAERAAAECLSLPIFPELTDEQQSRVIAAVRNVAAAMPATKRTSAFSSQTTAAVVESSKALPVADKHLTASAYEGLLQEFLSAGYEFAAFNQSEELLLQQRPFTLLRHDIDMDLQRALEIAHVEAKLGVQATYFFLLRTDHYNLLSERSTSCVRKILGLGHHLGLHFDCAAYPDNSPAAEVASEVSREANLLGDWFGRPIKIVSFHRPAPLVLEGSAELTAPLEHTYMPKFTQQLHYSSDSRGTFRHGWPTQLEAFQQRRPMQLLTHPIWWGEQSVSPVESLHQLRHRRETAFAQSIAENCETYRDYLNQAGRLNASDICKQSDVRLRGDAA